MPPRCSETAPVLKAHTILQQPQPEAAYHLQNAGLAVQVMPKEEDYRGQSDAALALVGRIAHLSLFLNPLEPDLLRSGCLTSLSVAPLLTEHPPALQFVKFSF